MALDIEHHTKLQLLRMMDKFNEDGYQIVQDYLDSLSEVQRKICDSEINRNKGNIYCGDIVECLLYTSPSPRDRSVSRMPSSA